MKAKVETKIGHNMYQFEVEERDDMETLLKIAGLGNHPGRCHVCENKEFFRLDGRRVSEGKYIYISKVCLKCGARANLGQYQNGGFFWRKFEKYEKNAERNVEKKQEESILFD